MSAATSQPDTSARPLGRRLERAALAAACGLALLSSASSLAKPLYITVPRAYGTAEAPIVELAFSGREPVELRVLKPVDLDAFIARQFNVRRVYEPPTTTANPGWALARGLNGVRNPSTTLVKLLSPAFRTALAPSLPERPPAEPFRRPPLREGPPKLVGVPDGLTLVTTEYLNLDLGGAQRDFSVPGFDDAFGGGGSSGFQDRRLALRPLPAGLYVLQLVQGTIEGQVLLVVSDLAAQVKQTDGSLLVRAADAARLPLRGAAVSVHLPNGQVLRATTNDDGEARLEVREPRVVVTVAAGADTALVDTDFYSTLAVTPDVFIYTDRPIYRPGDKVRFRGIVRQPDTFLARLFRPRNPAVRIVLSPDQGSEVTTRATVGDFGTFSGEATVPADLETVVVRARAVLDDREHQAELRVQEYVKPTFFLELLSEGETVSPGERLSLKVRARRYAGGAPKGAAYEVFLYRSQLDAPAWVDDSGRGGKGSAVTYGSASTREGTLSVPQRLYSSVEERKAGADGADPWSTAPAFDEQGEAVLQVPVPDVTAADRLKPWRYTVSVRARDAEGSFATGAQAFFLSDIDLLATVRATQKLVRPGEKAGFAVRATTLSGKSYGVARGSLVVEWQGVEGAAEKVLEREIATDEAGTLRVEAVAPRPGRLEARVTLQAKQGRAWTGSDATLVFGSAGEPVARVPSMVLESASQVLEPRATGELVGLLPEHWGTRESNEGALWLTFGGAGLFRTERLSVRGTSFVHRFDVEERFGSAVYVSAAYPTPTGRWEERTVPFRIVPTRRLLRVTVSPERAEAPPLGEQRLELRVTDSEGAGVQAELSVGVVDKAIYALQSEFRPGVLDFFYPLTRHNVTTFSGADFQGLGYGDRLARALGGLPHHAFAALKPPQKPQREQDTAYWNPSVLTDRDGRARVGFKLPSNQTLWTVTAVATDAAGRFGESTAEFATRGTVNVAANLPQFLRVGDRATGFVRASLGAKAKAPGPLSVRAVLRGALAAGEATGTLALEAGAEGHLPLRLEAKSEGPAELRVQVSGLGDPLDETRQLTVEPAAVEETLVASRRGEGPLAVELPVGATVVSSSVTVVPSLLGAALENLRELLAYPYGCVEQLVATTVPNLAIYRTLQTAQAHAKLDTEAQALLAEAQSRATQGSARILQAAVKGSGFAWYQGSGAPSVPMTLVALDGLLWAVDAGLVSKDDARIVDAARWLERQEELPMPLAAQRAYVLARYEGKKQAPTVRNLLSGAAGDDPLGLALAALAAGHAGIADEPAVRTRLTELGREAQAAYFKPAAWSGADEWAWRYPLRRVGYAAILGNAGRLADTVDDAAMRRRALELLTEAEASTFDRSMALLHSQWLIARELRAFGAAAAPEVRADGAPVSLTASAGTFGAVLPATAKALSVGPTEAATTWRVRVRTPLALVKPRGQAMSLSRRYFVLRGDAPVPLAGDAAVRGGEDVFVELEFDAADDGEARSGRRSAYVVLEDAVPAGFTVVQEDKAYRGAPWSLPLSHESLARRVPSPQRVTWLFEAPAPWSASPRRIGYVLRADFEGTFSAPPATVRDMYATEVHARSAPAVLKVEAPSAR